MSTYLGYTAVLIFDTLTVVLRELSATEDERSLELRVNGKACGELCLRPWYLPRLAIGKGEIFLWGGIRAYFLDRPGGPLRLFEFDDEIHGAYRLSGFWCVICETSVVLWTSKAGVVISECHHNEILLGSWWEDEQLFVEDLQNRCFEVKIDERELTVVLWPQEAAEPPPVL